MGLKFEKTNVEIRISILEILCVCASFHVKQTALTFFGIRISILEILCMPIFRQNG